MHLIDGVLSLARRTGDAKLLLGALNSAAERHRGDGNPDAAQPLYEEALALARKQRNMVRVAIIGDNLVRAISMQPTDGLVRGTEVTDTGDAITVDTPSATQSSTRSGDVA